jgi:hypothetical protein
MLVHRIGRAVVVSGDEVGEGGPWIEVPVLEVILVIFLRG